VKIAVLTPSRGRPERFLEMCEAIRDTADEHVQVFCALDGCDKAKYMLPEDAICLRGPRQRLAQWTNTLAERALADGYDILGFLGDDHRPRTQGWDTRVKQAMAQMGSGLVYCADGLQNERLPTAPFWSSDVIRACGFFYPPVLMHLYADDYWLRLANDLGRRTYLPDVSIEHLHPSAKKAAYDETYRENDTWYEHDRYAFEQFVIHRHPDVLDRVVAALA
jgi:hypothetical protein